MTEHICSCEICTANRALYAVMQLSWPPEYKEQLAALDAAVDAIVDKAANDEMEYAWHINRIGEMLGIDSAWPDLIVMKIKELQARVTQEATAP